MKLITHNVMNPIQDIWEEIGSVEGICLRDEVDNDIWNHIESRMGLEFSEHTDRIEVWGETFADDFESGWNL